MPRRARSGTLTLVHWTWRHARRFPAELAAVSVFMAASVALSVLKPWPLVFLVDYVLKERPMPSWLRQGVDALPGAADRSALLAWTVSATLLVFLLDWACGLGSRYANVTLGQRITQQVAADLLRRLQQLSLAFHTRRSTGDSIRRVTADCGSVATIFRDALLPVVRSAASLGLMLGIMWRINVELTLLALLVVPYMVLVFRAYAGPMMRHSDRQEEAEGRIYGVVEQTFSAMPAVKAFGREAWNQARFREAAGATLRAALSSLNVQLRFKVLMGLGTAAGTAGMIWIGSGAALRGELSLGDIILFLSYLGALYAPIEGVMYTGSTIQSAGGSARRVLEVLHTEPEVVDRAHAPALPRARGRVRFENVSFGYGDGRMILRDVSLDVRPGETVALVGPTGAGKSTLVSLVPRFFDPLAGRVLIDGHDLRDVQLASLRAQVGLVLQEPFLFPLTIAENIAYGRPGASRGEVEAAARAANAHEFILRLPQGYDTVIGERGATLSGGERQRVSIARALLKDAPILILDEPTSALDAGTEALIMAALRSLVRDRTTFVIAHRLATVRHADRIVVLREGAVVEAGRHEELLGRDGLYAEFARLQGLAAS